MVGLVAGRGAAASIVGERRRPALDAAPVGRFTQAGLWRTVSRPAHLSHQAAACRAVYALQEFRWAVQSQAFEDPRRAEITGDLPSRACPRAVTGQRHLKCVAISYALPEQR